MKAQPGERRESIVNAFLRLLEEWHGHGEVARVPIVPVGRVSDDPVRDKSRTETKRAPSASSGSLDEV
jgi:hypothetical protein